MSQSNSNANFLGLKEAFVIFLGKILEALHFAKNRMKKTLPIIFFYIIGLTSARAQSNQEKAQELISNYLGSKTNTLNTGTNIKFNPVKVLRSSFSDTKPYRNLTRKVDSLKIEGKRIDARIPKMKTTAELNQAKKDSKHLSDALVATSDELIDFMTSYKGQQTGWIIKPVKSIKINPAKRIKTFYLDKELTKVDSAK